MSHASIFPSTSTNVRLPGTRSWRTKRPFLRFAGGAHVAGGARVAGGAHVAGGARAAGFAALTLLVAAITGCAGVGPPRPNSGYQADLTVRFIEADGSSAVLGRLVEFYSSGNRRRETRVDGKTVALIDRPDLQISWMLNLDQQSFQEFPISSRDALISFVPNPFGPRVHASYEWLNQESLEGQTAHRYAIEGEAVSGFAWFTQDQIPIRFEGTLGRGKSVIQIQVRYGEILRGAISPGHFDIPSTYQGYAKRTKKAPEAELTDDDMARLREQKRRIQRRPRRQY